MFSLRADLCVITSINRFTDTPKDYHPVDILPSCKSVICFRCRFTVGILNCKSDIPYTRAPNSITPKIDQLRLISVLKWENIR